MSEDRNEQSGSSEGGSRPPRRFGGGGGGRSFPRRKVCGFCVDGIKHVDYKDVPRMRRFISDRGMIEPRRKTGTCAKHQRSLTTAIKRARHLALLSFIEGGREPRDRGGRDRDRGPRGGGGRFGRDRFEGGGQRFEGGGPRFEGGGQRFEGGAPRFDGGPGEQRAPQPPASETGPTE